MHGQDLTKGNIRRQMWSLAWPLMLSVFFYTLYNLVDALWVGRISPEAIAAVSISQVTLFAMVALSMGLTVGSGVLIAMHIGAKNMGEAERILAQSFVLSFIAGIFFTAIALLFRDSILRMAGATGSIFPLAIAYYTVTAAGLVLLFMLITIVFAFNSQGDTLTLTKLFALSTLANIALDPLLIFGWNGLPAMGIAGAAIATLISQLLFIMAAFFVLSRPSMMVPFHFRKLTVKRDSAKKVFAIGFPAALTNVLGPLGSAAIIAIASASFAEAGAVSASIGTRIEFFAFLPAIGYGFGTMAMVGQNIGAKNFARAREAYRHGIKAGFFLALVLGVLAALFANPLIALFTADMVVTGYTLLYLWSVPLTFGFFAALIIEASCFQGIGKSWPGFWIQMLKYGIITVPLSIFLTQIIDISIIGIWVAVGIGNVVAAITGIFWLNRTLTSLMRHRTAQEAKA